MTLDPRIHEAIVDSASALGQDQSLANRLIAWMTALADGNETLNDRDSVHRHIELLYEATATEIADEPNGGHE